jgi:toxin ParE1/3/4
MARVIWAEPALLELDEIADYISLDNPAAAKKLVRKVFDRVNQLKRHPKSGKPVPELEASIYREVYVSPCRVFYRVEEEKERVYIVHVIREDQLLHVDVLKSR